jgi:hypothetical protein
LLKNPPCPIWAGGFFVGGVRNGDRPNSGLLVLLGQFEQPF